MAVWFRDLFGVEESTYLATQSAFTLTPSPTDISSSLLIAPNGQSFPTGTFTTPSLTALRSNTPSSSPSLLSLTHIAVGDILSLHALYPNATFQVASQFNALEFPTPFTTPEKGITSYALDRTQGPACSLACPAATFVRNYCIPIGKQTGQTAEKQLNLLRPLLAALPRSVGDGIIVENGYTSAAGHKALAAVEKAIAGLDPEARERLIGELCVGVHSRVGVVYESRWKEVSEDVRVTQVFCSALSIAYSGGEVSAWEGLARVVLDACYEAVLRVAEIERQAGIGSGLCFLTFVGGGVFKNKAEWIAGAIGRAVRRCEAFGLDVRVCHYREIDDSMRDLISGQ